MNVHVNGQQIPREVVELCRTLADKGYRAWIVGGCLRDLLLGRVAADWDLATDAKPEEVSRVFPKVLPTGIAHGTVTVRHRGKSFEVTTLRGEGAYSDGRRPDSVAFVSDIEEDLARRDFTVNAIACDPLTGALVDPFQGRADLERKLIRAVGEAERRFAEDGLRVLRAARFCASLEFELEPATEAAIPGSLATFRKVSAERVRDEWMKALRALRPSRAFAVMVRTGILAETYPRLAALPSALLETSVAALDAVGLGRDPILRLAVLLWPLRDSLDEVADWITRYRFSNQERERLVRLLRFAFAQTDQVPSAADLRRLAFRMGRPHLGEVGALSAVLAEAHAGQGSPTALAASATRDMLLELAAAEVALSPKELALSGKDLMEELGLTPGPRIGATLQTLMDRVLEDPSLNERARLVELARSLV